MVVLSQSTNTYIHLTCVDVIHPAGWVIEGGGVALSMVVDPVLSIAFCNGFHVFLSSLCLNSIGFIVFLCAGREIWTFHPRKSTQFLEGHFAK